MSTINSATKRNPQAGQALYLTAMSLVVVIGFLGFGIDLGALRYEKRLQQTAADAAAIAGASNLPYNGGAGVVTAALDAAQSDGFGDTGTYCSTGCPNSGDAGYVTVTVNDPPSTGPHSGAPMGQYVEVLVSAVHPTYFMRVFGITKETVAARAVAANVGSTGCLYALSSRIQDYPNDGIQLNSGSSITATGCNVLDDADLNMNDGSITANSIGVSAGCGGGGCSGASPTPVTGMPPSGDPLAYLTPPLPSGGCQPANVSGNAFPGNYCNGLTVAGTTVFHSGVYVVLGNLTFTTAGTVSDTGTGGEMFYVTNYGTVNWGTTTNQTNLSAPTSSDSSTGAVAGVLFWQDVKDLNSATISGNGSSSLEGVLYFPEAEWLTMNISNVPTPYTIVIADAFAVGPNTVLSLGADTSSLTGGSPIKNAALVE